jgi:heat shock protein HslJ
MQDCPAASNEYAYQLEATNADGTSRLQQFVRVVQPATPIPTATPTIPPSTATPVPPTPTPIPDPVIYSFTASPAQITLGGQVRVSWNVGGGAETVNVYKNGALVLENAAFQDSVVDQPGAAGTIAYAIEALNSVGGKATDDASIAVVEAPPDNPLAGTAWQLLSYYNGSAEQPVVPGSTVTANFDSNSEMAGTGGCNTYSASYTVNGNQITITDVLSLQISCGSELDQQEAAYFALLPTAVTYTIEDSQLTISDADEQVILTYSALVATPF